MTPIHGVPSDLLDSDPNLAAVPEKELDEGVSKPTSEREQAHYFRCMNEPGGPVHELKKEVKAITQVLDGVTRSLVASRATFRTWGKIASLSFAAMTLAVGILTYISATRGQAAAHAHVVPQARAEAKGTP